MKKLLLSSAILSVVTHTAIAAESADVEAYLGAAQYFYDSERNLEDTTAIEGGLELPIGDALSLEAWLSDFDAEPESGAADLDGLRYSLGALYHLDDGKTRPFISAGASHQEFEPENGDANDETLLHVGLGIKHYYDNNIVMRAEALAMNSYDNEMTDYAVRLAIGYAFGRSVSAAPAPVVESVKPAPVVKTEPKPEPKPVPVVVVEKPAPVDSDGDGVFDDADQCANTSVQFKVDATGCPVMLTESVSIEMEVNFKTNSDEILPEDYAEIKRVADFMSEFEGTKVTVEGHTDDRGRASYNKALSQKRAESVRQVLIKSFKIDPSRVDAVGYGEERPIADNATAEGRSANRRVVGQIESSLKRPATK